MGAVPPFFTFYGAASSTAPGFVTTGTQTFTGKKTFTGAAADGGPAVFVEKTAEASVSEAVARFGVSGLTGDYLSIQNNTTTSNFLPTVLGLNSTTNTALTLVAQGTTDTGASGVFRYISRIGASSVPSTRFAYDWSVGPNTTVMTLSGAGALVVSGGTAPSIGVGTAKWRSGTGSPESVVTGNVGDLWTRTDGGASTCLYVKESGTGNTGWVAK